MALARSTPSSGLASCRRSSTRLIPRAVQRGRGRSSLPCRAATSATYACWVAKKMGLPMRLIVCTNETTRWTSSLHGCYAPKPSSETDRNVLALHVSSRAASFERFLFDARSAATAPASGSLPRIRRRRANSRSRPRNFARSACRASCRAPRTIRIASRSLSRCTSSTTRTLTRTRPTRSSRGTPPSIPSASRRSASRTEIQAVKFPRMVRQATRASPSSRPGHGRPSVSAAQGPDACVRSGGSERRSRG